LVAAVLGSYRARRALKMSEKLVASRGVTVNRQELAVSISQHSDEQFWRVQVRHPVGLGATGTVLDSDDDYFCGLVRSAVAGEGSAWESLAHWGSRRINRSGW
jgi:hypothetical protein